MDDPVEAAPAKNGGSADTASGAAANAHRARTRWMRDVAAPFALGVATLAGWIGALVLSDSTMASFVVLRAAQGAVLLAPALLIPLIAVAINRDYWRASGRGLRNAAVNLLLALLVIVVGLALAFLAVTPTPPAESLNSVLRLPFAAPGFSLGVALGFAWGSLPRPIGASAGLLGGLGFCLPTVLWIVITIVIAKVAPNSVCSGAAGAKCNPYLENAVDILLAIILLASAVFAVSLGFIGGILGAYLRRR